MVTCTDTQQMLIDGKWTEAVTCMLTAGGDPTMQVVVPTGIYGAVLLSMFVYSSSSIMPTVVSIILAGVIFAAFPANAVTVVLMMVMAAIAAVGQLMTWRMGR